MRTIGVLGGMGPEATIALMARVVAAVRASDDADHIPLLVDQNTQVPSRISALIDGTGTSPAPALGQMAARLEAAGAEALVMACNTAHHYSDAVTASAGIPFLNMIDLAADRAAQLANGGVVGVLASPAVAKVGLYETALRLRGLDFLQPESDELLAVVRAVKAHGPTQEGAEGLKPVAQGLADQGAKVQILACTEFSLLSPDLSVSGVQFVDALDVLVEAMVRFAKADAP